MLQAVARSIDSYPWFAFLLVTAACSRVRVGDFAARFLDHDEIYSFYIAQAPTLKQLLFLTRTADLHPPLSYLLIRLSFALFGVNNWACRLPFLLAFLCASAAIFSFARKALSPLYGLIAVVFLWSVLYARYAAEARPYSLILCFTSLMLISWYESIVSADSSWRGRRGALLIFAAAEFALLLSHVLGVFSVAVFCGVEVIRLMNRRKADWPFWTAILAPCVCVLTYLPLIHSGSVILFTERYRATPLRLFHFYWEFLSWLPMPLTFVLLVSFLWPAKRQSPSAGRGREAAAGPPAGIFRSIAWLLLLFSLVPLAIGAMFARTGMAFFDRYGIVFFIPIALAPALLVSWRTRCNQAAGASVLLVVSTIFVLNSVGKVWLIEQVSMAPPRYVGMLLDLVSLPVVGLPKNQPAPAHLVSPAAGAEPIRDLNAIEPEIPLVANTGLTFLELDRQADDALASRLFLLNDANAATAIAHDTVFENYSRVKQAFPIRGQIAPFCSFIRAHRKFLVMGDYNHAQGWLLKKLDYDGAELQALGHYDQHTTEDGHLYEVTVRSSPCLPEPTPSAGQTLLPVAAGR